MATGNDSSTDPSMLRILSGPRSEVMWRKFFDRYSPLIHEACRQAGLQPADADEIHSRVFLKLSQALPKFEYDPAQRFRGWLSRIVMHEIIDYWTELKRRPGAAGRGGDGEHLASIPDSLRMLPDEIDAGLADDFERADQIITRVKNRVKESTWQSWWQTACDGLPAEEVARILGISQASVYVNRQRVQTLLKEEGDSGHWEP